MTFESNDNSLNNSLENQKRNIKTSLVRERTNNQNGDASLKPIKTLRSQVGFENEELREIDFSLINEKEKE